MSRSLLSLILLSISFCSLAQVKPVNGDTLNYRLIGFTVPINTVAKNYMLEIAEGNHEDIQKFQQSIIYSKANLTNKFIATVPSFGKEYTWRVTYTNKKGKPVSVTELYHFTTGTIQFVDPKQYIVNVHTVNEAYKDLLVFFDGLRTLNDINGQPVWYLPNIDTIINDDNRRLRDIKLTPDGTITFISGKDAYEIDYDGNLLWSSTNTKEPNGKNIFFHHDFTKMANGHYMALTKVDDKTKNGDAEPAKDVSELRQEQITEYDANGGIVWNWSIEKYLKGTGGSTDQKVLKTHVNSCYFDNKQQAIYLSLKDMNSIIKIAYPSGTVVNTYGQGYPGLTNKISNVTFRGQHSCGLSHDGHVYLYNNNLPTRDSRAKGEEKRISSLLLFKEPVKLNDTLVKVWEFECDIDTLAQPMNATGGSMQELKNGSFLVSMGSVNRVLIVNRDKKILWNVITTTNDGNSKSPIQNYRVHAVETKEQLEKLLFR